ncbi:hypothetical protein L798_10380 [Zootermopsis nevadensis]|uniref:Uncharacterized protein n=1 Tax=Zootermopsis nevadensis TaxID=136037 RepID=A0A067R7N1_ZOONE|nr:hypothetical protein L798_10380 [Zootermopsis nevadensis]
MAGTKSRASFRELLKKFNILPLASEFLLSLFSSVVNNIEKFQTNSDIHNIRYRYNPHVATLASVNIKKESTVLKLSFSIISPTIKSLNHDIKKFKPALKEYLLTHTYYIEFTSTKNPQLL